jgi:hypothetical protein
MGLDEKEQKAMEHFELISSETVNELDASVLRAWRIKDRRRNEREAAGRFMAVKCFCIAALMAAVVWLHAVHFETALKTVVSAGAAIVAYQACSARRYGFTTIFALIFVLFNPCISIMNLSGSWEFAVLVATIAAFSLSLFKLRSSEYMSSMYRN